MDRTTISVMLTQSYDRHNDTRKMFWLRTARCPDLQHVNGSDCMHNITTELQHNSSTQQPTPLRRIYKRNQDNKLIYKPWSPNSQSSFCFSNLS